MRDYCTSLHSMQLQAITDRRSCKAVCVCCDNNFDLLFVHKWAGAMATRHWNHVTCVCVCVCTAGL